MTTLTTEGWTLYGNRTEFCETREGPIVSCHNFTTVESVERKYGFEYAVVSCSQGCGQTMKGSRLAPRQTCSACGRSEAVDSEQATPDPRWLCSRCV